MQISECVARRRRMVEESSNSQVIQAGSFSKSIRSETQGDRTQVVGEYSPSYVKALLNDLASRMRFFTAATDAPRILRLPTIPPGGARFVLHEGCPRTSRMAWCVCSGP